jgi:hypothetical protein
MIFALMFAFTTVGGLRVRRANSFDLLGKNILIFPFESSLSMFLSV